MLRWHESDCDSAWPTLLGERHCCGVSSVLRSTTVQSRPDDVNTATVNAEIALAWFHIDHFTLHHTQTLYAHSHHKSGRCKLRGGARLLSAIWLVRSSPTNNTMSQRSHWATRKWQWHLDCQMLAKCDDSTDVCKV